LGSRRLAFGRWAIFSALTRQELPSLGKSCRFILVNEKFLPGYRFSPMSKKHP
jgi:hypothetical protein